MGRRKAGGIGAALILGLLIFIPIYTYMLFEMKRIGIDSSELMSVWLSFDEERFAAFAGGIAERGHSDSFASIYRLNSASVIGYTLAFLSLSLMLARSVDGPSGLRKAARAFTPVPIAVGALDLASNIILVSALSGRADMSSWMMAIVSGTYAARSVLFLFFLLWLAGAGSYIAAKRIRRRRFPSR